MGWPGIRRVAAAVIVAGAVAPNAGAATWSEPALVGDDGTRGPDIHLDDAGTVRIVEGVKPDSAFDVATIRSGSSKVGRCRVPGTDENTPMARLSWEVNPSGAMAAGWHEGGETGRVLVATGRRGRCFARARAVSPRGVGFNGMRIGAGGTVVVYWLEAAGAGARLVAVTVPRDDGPVKRRTVFTVPTVRVSHVRGDFVRDDRIVWTWLTDNGEDGPGTPRCSGAPPALHAAARPERPASSRASSPTPIRAGCSPGAGCSPPRTGARCWPTPVATAWS